MARTSIRITLFLAILASFASPLSAVDYIINWQPNPEPYVSKYIIYRSLSPVISSFVPIDSVDAGTTTYIDTGLEEGVRYYYRLIAANNAGDRSGYSNPVSGLTIPQDADESMKDMCRVTSKDSVALGSYDINWSTLDQTIGFVQYDTDIPLNFMSPWDDDTYELEHMVNIDELTLQEIYYLRAVSYDNSNNMTISTIDTLEVEGEEAQPISSPQLNIYPVPYNPGAGSLSLDNLPAGGSVTIFNENALEVWRENVGMATSMDWYGNNIQGSPVMSGIYYVVVKNADGEVIEKRPIVVVN